MSTTTLQEFQASPLAQPAVKPNTNTTTYRSSIEAGLPSVSNPDKAYADMTKNEYLDYVQNYRSFENELINKSQTDNSMVDQAYTDSSMAIGLNQGIAQRNLDRYGGSLTGAQKSEQGRAFQRIGSLGTNDSVNNARIAQKEGNQGLMADLINIGQGVNRASSTQMQSAAQQSSAREMAYQQQKEAGKQSTWNTIGQIGTMALTAWAI